MLKIFVSESVGGAFQPFIDYSEDHETLEVVGVARTGVETAKALRVGEFDALVFPDEWAELCRAIRVSLGLSPGSGPSFVVGAEELSTPLIIKSALYGFDGAVPAQTDPETSAARILNIAEGNSSFADEPLLRDLGIQPGVLARRITASDKGDLEIADLVAAGLPDSDIARVTGLSVQLVRNRIEHMLHTNSLTHRTQLAVLKASLWEVPDFA